MMSSQVNVD